MALKFRIAAYLVAPVLVFFVSGWFGATLKWSCVAVGGWIVLAALLVEVLGRGLVDWMRVVRSG